MIKKLRNQPYAPKLKRRRKEYEEYGVIIQIPQKHTNLN
jgi:hypothetical protein